jgi:cell division protein ZapA
VTSIKVNILGKQYPLRVEENEVETTHEIARYVNQRMKKYRKELPQQSITTVMVMAAMSLAEEAIEEGEDNKESGKSDRIQQINTQLEEMLDELREEVPQSEEKAETQDSDEQ